ncbi:MAG: DMT family transporter [Kouleothrix sp.]|nr:DMT family transporter [Kouleothrix sp.]
MGILFGLTAALGWGLADFMVTSVARRIGVTQAMFYLQLVGLLTIGAVLLRWPDLPAPTPTMWVVTIGISLINLAGTLLLYRSFAIGTLAIVSPIASGFAVVTALLALLGGERPAPIAIVGALLLIGGVAVVSRSHHAGAGARLAGVPEAIGVVICFGFYFWSLDLVRPALGAFWPVAVTRAVEMVGALLLLLRRGAPPARLPRSLWPTILVAALLDTLAFVAFNLGAGTTYTSIVTALASLFSAVTVLMAWAILRERLSRAQWAGVAVILCGVLLVSL